MGRASGEVQCGGSGLIDLKGAGGGGGCGSWDPEPGSCVVNPSRSSVKICGLECTSKSTNVNRYRGTVVFFTMPCPKRIGDGLGTYI